MSEEKKVPATKSPPHTGEMLKKYSLEKRIRKAAWGRFQGVRKETITGYFKKQTMQISTLFTICQVLNYNFFKEITNALPAEMPPHQTNELEAQNIELKKEIEKLTMKIEILEKMLMK